MKIGGYYYLGIYLVYLTMICLVRFVSDNLTKYVVLLWTIYQMIIELLQLKKTA